MELSAAQPPDAELIERLRLTCGAAQVITDHASLQTFRSDGLPGRERAPRVAVLPGTVAEVQAVVRACCEYRVPFVSRGAGTGLAGGALAGAESVLIVLTRLREIVSVDLPAAVVVVEAGVTTAAVSDAVAPTHFYAPDPSSREISTIGGNVACNAGGPRALKYGATGDHVIGLDVVLSDGSLVALRRDQPGYDLVGACVGSEGTLGVIVRAHLRIVPTPDAWRLATASFATSALAGDALSAVIAAGLVPAAVALMDADATEAAQAATGVRVPSGAGATLIIEFDGPRGRCEAELSRTAALLSAAGALAVTVADGDRERERLWRLRHGVLPALGRISPDFEVCDVVVPRMRLGQALRRIQQLAGAAGLRVTTAAHAGDGSLHSQVFYDDSHGGEATRASALVTEIASLAVALGGSITGEYGVGADGARQLPLMFDTTDLAAFERVRRAFDPAQIANRRHLMPATAGGHQEV